MKILKFVIKILIIIIIVFALITVWLYLQGKGVIVMNNAETIIGELHAISKLETAEVTISKNLTAEQKLNDYVEGYSFDNIINELLFQDKMEFSMTGRVVAGIDLEKIKTGDIITKIDGTINIRLPEAEILSVEIEDNAIVSREIGLLTKGNVNMETQLRDEAKKQMIEEAIEAGILDKANENAYNTLSKLLTEFKVSSDNRSRFFYKISGK